MKGKTLLLIGLIAAAISTRFIPHYPNFTAMGAAALFGGVVFKDHFKAFLIPLLALFLSDLVLNNVVYAAYNEGFTFFTEGFYWIYGAFILTVIMGKYATNGFKILPLLATGVASALVFYLLTNFGSWLGNPLYPQNIGGLMASYAAGLPFLVSQAAGTIVYGAVMFGAAYAITSSKSAATANA